MRASGEGGFGSGARLRAGDGDAGTSGTALAAGGGRHPAAAGVLVCLSEPFGG